MNELFAFIDISLPFNPQTCWWVCMSLLHTAWQACVIALAVSLFLRYSPASFYLRFRVALTALVLIGCTPFLNYTWLTRSDAPMAVQTAAQQYVRTGSMKLFALRELANDNSIGLRDLEALGRSNKLVALSTNGGLSDSNRSSQPTQGDRSTVLLTPASTQSSIGHASWFVVLSATATLAYVLGVLFMVFRLGLGLRNQHQLARSSLQSRTAGELSSEVQNESPFVLRLARRASQSLGRQLRTPIAIFAGQGTALVVGIVRPSILVNTTLVTGLTPDQLEQILAHELAHVFRFDPLTQLVQRVVESILFFHPAVWRLSRSVSQLRELCCDAWTVETRSPVEYADTLLQCYVMHHSHHAPQKPELALSAMGSQPNQLTTRIDALLNANAGREERNASVTKLRMQTSRSLGPMALTTRGLLAISVGLLVVMALSWPAIPLLSRGQAIVPVNPAKLLANDPNWNWQRIGPDEIERDDLLLNGTRLNLTPNRPVDIEIQAMLAEQDCRFAQWHFGDSTSTRLAVVVEMIGGKVGRIFLDADRDRKIEADEEVTTVILAGKTWVADVTAEVRDGTTSIHGKRQIAITPKHSVGTPKSDEPDTIRIATLGFAAGEVELSGQRYATRRVDMDGNGLPNESRDQLWIDLDSDGSFDFITERFGMANNIELSSQRYSVRSDRLGHALQLSSETERGFVRFVFEPKGSGTTLDVLEGALRDKDGMLIAVRLTDEPMAIPPGRYCIESLFVQTRDADQATWRMNLSAGANRDWIDVKSGQYHDVELLTGFKFTAKAVHQLDSWTGHLTQLKPSLVTDNGLLVTELVHLKPGSDPHAMRLLDTATFSIRNALDVAANSENKPTSACSGFS